MSKFLKFIVHFVMLCTIICVVALTVPPFYGIETVIIDDNSEVTNLELGSVTYAIPAKTTEVNLGTPLLVKDTNDGVTKTYKYNLATVDLTNGTGTVIDPDAAERENINVSIKNVVPKVVITIPYLGYLWVATQSIEGLIVLGLAILFLVILYVIAELWKKDAEEEEEDYEEEEIPVKSAKELKREEKERAKRMKEEDKELLREAKNDKKKNKKEKKASRKIIKTGGFVDEIYEDELQEEEEEETSVDIQNAASEAHELLKKEIAAATAEEPQTLEKEAELEKTQNLETEAITVKNVKSEKVMQQEETELIKVAVPQPTAMQLAAAAKKAGDKPDIVRDPITKVTLFDYSDIITEIE